MATIFILMLLISGANADILNNIKFMTIDGKTINTEKMPVVVNIMATWCAACKHEAVELQKAYLSYKTKGVQFIGVFIKSSEEDIKEFIKKYHISFPVGIDNGIAKKIGATSIPVTLFITKDGKVAQKYFGPAGYSKIVLGIENALMM
jgi:thiol-disulfide isomerase/thioredoxin